MKARASLAGQKQRLETMLDGYLANQIHLVQSDLVTPPGEVGIQLLEL